MFYDEVDFYKILNLYVFDRKLSVEFLDALEKIEKSIKTRITYVLSHSHGKFCINENKEYSHIFQSKINKELKWSREVFLRTYKYKYQDEYYPIWMIMEVLTLGTTLDVLLNSPTQARKEVARFYAIGTDYLESWIDNLREVRNICAHHSRLWNRNISKKPQKEKTSDHFQYNNKVYDSIIITARLLKIISPNSEWLEKIKKLIIDHEINTGKMGFPENWEEIFSEFISVKQKQQ